MACKTVARSGGSAGIDVNLRPALYTRAGWGPAKFRSIESAIGFGETCSYDPIDEPAKRDAVERGGGGGGAGAFAFGAGGGRYRSGCGCNPVSRSAAL